MSLLLVFRFYFIWVTLWQCVDDDQLFDSKTRKVSLVIYHKGVF